MKVITLAPVKNEERNITSFLENASKFSDFIILADQQSTDRTKEIALTFPKVIIVDYHEEGHTNRARWTLLNEARKIPGNNLLIALDADEVIQPKWVVEAREKLASLQPPIHFSFPWIQLWKSYDQYRDDGVWKDSRKIAGWLDDREIDYEKIVVTNDHVSRVPGKGLPIIELKQPILHLQYTNIRATDYKQAWYKISEFLKGKNPKRINHQYSNSKDSDEVTTKEVSKEWFKEISLPSLTYSEEYSWQREEIMQWFYQYGVVFFESLDIWYIEEFKQLFITKTKRAPKPLQYPQLLITLNNIKHSLQGVGFLKYFKNTSWMLGNRVYGMLIGFFITVFVTRYLGPENYGMLSYSLSFVGLFAFIAGLGLDQVLYRNLIKERTKEPELLGTSLVLRLGAGSLAALFAIISATIIGERGIMLWLIAIVSTAFIFQAFNVINYAFQARVQSKFPSIATFIVVTLLALLKLLTIYYSKGIYFFAMIYTVEPFLYAILFLYFYKNQYGSPLKWKFSMGVAKPMLIASSPLILSTVFTSIYSRIDQVFIKHLIDVSSVGIYDAAVRVAELWYFIPAIFITSFFPSIVNSFTTDKNAYSRRILLLTAFLVGISLCVGIVTTLFSRFIMTLIFGTEFASGYMVLRLYVWSGVGVSIGSVLNHYLITEDLTRVILYISIVGMVINVVLNLILIPRYGISGAAIATLISYTVGPLSVFCFASSRTRLISLWKNYR